MSSQKPVTSTASEILSAAWAAIREDIQNEAGTFSRRVFKESGLAIFANVSEPDGLAGISFEVAPSSIKLLQLSFSARGFEVQVERIADTIGLAAARISIRLTHRLFTDLFNILALDIVNCTLGGSSEPEAMRCLNDRLQHWRSFAEKVGSFGLKPHEQTGLFGELLFMNNLLTKGIMGDMLVSAWHGPFRENQDYCFGEIAVEVKASTSNTPQEINISSERQLDSTGLDKLFLFHASLERRQGAGKLLPDLIAEISERLQEFGTELQMGFVDRLFEQGYHGSQAALYEEYGYTVRELDIYDVREGFPRILESELDDGVSRVRYQVNLAAAGSFRVTMENLISSING